MIKSSPAKRSLRLLPILIVALSLVLSLRVTSIVQEVSARATPEPRLRARELEPSPSLLAVMPAAGPDKPATPPANAASDAPPSRSTADEPGTFSAAEVEILQELAQRRAAIDKRSRDLAERESLLQAAEKQIEKKLQELKQLQGAVEATLKRHDDDDDVRKKSLVKIFEGMKPPEAARIFEQMELAQLVDIIERMKERSVSPIMAQLHPVRARQVAAELAKRRIPVTGQAPKAG